MLKGGYVSRVIIFANGLMAHPRDTAARWIRDGDLVVAADGGTHHVLAAGWVPDHVIGDLDSLSEDLRARLEAQGTTFHTYPPAKDATDLELALLWAVKHHASRIKHHVSHIIVLGALGGRPDQALANMLLLALPELADMDILIADEDWTIRCLRSGKTHPLHGQPGDRLSLIPLNGSAEGVTTTGLAYALNEETLHFGRARGVSNVFEAEVATVMMRQGMLWCFQEWLGRRPATT